MPNCAAHRFNQDDVAVSFRDLQVPQARSFDMTIYTQLPYANPGPNP